MKDYEKPYFKEYMKLCSEIEMLPASEQETKVITMFHEFYKKMTDSIEVSSGIAVRMIAKTASMQTSRDAWKKLAELFAEHWTVNLLGCHCIHCHKEQVWNMAGNTWKQTHSPNCPIEQLRKMKEGDNVHL